MSSVEPTLQARLDAFINFKVKHPRLEEMDRDLMRRIWGLWRNGTEKWFRGKR